MAAFGAFTGRGGIVGQRPYGLSSMFLGISEGLSDFGKAMQQSDLENKRLDAENAREIANQSFHMNLARFTAGEEMKREQARLTEQGKDRAEAIQARKDIASQSDARLREEADQRSKDRAAALSQHAADVAQREKDRAQSQAALEEQRKEHAELYKQQVEASKAALARGDSAEAERIAKDMVETPRLQVQTAEKELDAMRKSPGFDPDKPGDAYTSLQSELSDARTKLKEAEATAKDLRSQALKGINYGPKESAPPDPMAALSPDRQEWAKRAQTVRGLDPAAAAKLAASQPQDVIDRGNAMPPPTPAATPAAAPAQGGQPGAFLGDDGNAIPPPEGAQTPPTATASVDGSTPGPSGAEVQDQAAPAQTPDASATAQVDQGQDQQQDPAQRYDEMQTEMNQSPEGQSIMATLGRLATAKAGPVADKMRRTAEIQLEQQYPNDDANGFIDTFLDQNAEQIS